MSFLEPCRALSLSLTRIRSVTGEPGERTIITYLYDHLAALPAARRGEIDVFMVEAGPEHDPLRRPFVVAHLHGRGNRAALLLGHIDTVDTADYGALEPLATEPEALTAAIAGGALGERLAATARSGRYLFGRGLLDMKAGVAANAVALEALSSLPNRPHVLFAATGDEEVNSGGVKSLRAWLAAYCAGHGLTLAACLNTDYTTAIHDGDPFRHVYLGSIGKVLPAVTVRGVTSHAGEPSQGIDPTAVIAAIADRLVYRKELSDSAPGEQGPPPVSLRLSDDKERYDTQTALSATLMLNMLSLSRTPGEQLALVHQEVQTAVSQALERRLAAMPDALALDLPVLTFAQAVERAATRGQIAQLTSAVAALPAGLDLRERCRRAALLALDHAMPDHAAAIVYFATGLIPRVDSGLAVRDTVLASLHGLETKTGERFALETHFPFISDMSFLSLSADEQDRAFDLNFPPHLAGSVPLPPLAVPVINPGTYGFGPHRIDERLDLAYSCGILPEVIMRLALDLT